MYQHAPEQALTRMWEMHLQGVPKSRIAEELGIERHTVARHLRTMYREVAEERKIANTRKLDMAVARMRRVEATAWADHDADKGHPGGHRWHYLRLVLDVEKAIARLEGLYEVGALDAGEDKAKVFFIRREEGSGDTDSIREEWARWRANDEGTARERSTSATMGAGRRK